MEPIMKWQEFGISGGAQPRSAACRCEAIPTSVHLPPSPDETVDAPTPRAMRGEKQEDEAEQHGGLPVVLDGPGAGGLMELKIGYCHLPRQDEGNWLREEPEQDRSAPIKLQHAPDPSL